MQWRAASRIFVSGRGGAREGSGVRNLSLVVAGRRSRRSRSPVRHASSSRRWVAGNPFVKGYCNSVPRHSPQAHWHPFHYLARAAVTACFSWGNETPANIGPLARYASCDYVHPRIAAWRINFFYPHFRFEPTLEDESASISHNPRMGLGSSPEKGKTICKHSLQDQPPAFR